MPITIQSCRYRAWPLTSLLLLVGFVTTASAEGHSPADPELPDWRAAVERLEAAPRLRADFNEFRHTPARRNASRYTGVLRWDEKHGLSLAYAHPRAQTMVISPESMRRFDEDGQERRLPQGEETDLWTRMMLDIFALRVDAWPQDFDLELLEDEGDAWTLHLRARSDGAFDGLLRAIEISAEDNEIHTITFQRDTRRRTEIRLQSLEKDVEWAPGEIQNAFPARDE